MTMMTLNVGKELSIKGGPTYRADRNGHLDLPPHHAAAAITAGAASRRGFIAGSQAPGWLCPCGRANWNWSASCPKCGEARHG